MLIFVSLFCHALSILQLNAQTPSQDLQETLIAATLTEQEIEWLRENPVLTATNDKGWAPMDYVRAGKPAGFSVDYLKLIGGKLGVDIRFVSGNSWSDLVDQVRDKKIDILHGVIKGDMRNDYLTFTESYLDMGIAIYGRTGADEVTEINDLDGKVIGLINGFAIGEELQSQYPEFKFREFDLARDALTVLSSGSIDLFIGMYPTANYAINANFINDVEVVGRFQDLGFQHSAEIHLATHRDNEILSQVLRKGMLAVDESEVLKLENKWFARNTASGSLEFTDDEKAWIARHPVLRATNEMNWAPLDYVEDGKPMGFSVDYLNLLASKIGVEIQYVNGHTWTELMDLLEKREIDIAQSITKTTEREKYLDFTTPYLDMPKVYFGRVGAKPIKEVKDLEGRKIGLIKDWASSNVFEQEYPDLTTVYFDSAVQALTGISAGEIDVFLTRHPVGNYIIAKNFITGLEVLGNELSPENNGQNYLRLATRNDWPILNRILTKAMAAVSEDEFRRISRKWNSREYAENSLNLSSEELEWLSQNSDLKVLIDPNRAPYELLDKNNRVSGIAGAYLDIIAERLNISIEWAGNEGWGDGIPMFLEGDAHIVSGLVPTPAREERYNFTESYMRSTSAIFSRQGGEIFVNMDGLVGRKIAQEKDYALTSFIQRDYPGIEIVEVGSGTEALRMVAKGQVDAHIGDIPTVAYLIAKDNLPVMAAGETPYIMDTVFAVKKDNDLLASVMNKAMASITEAERAEIFNRWLAVKVENSLNKELILKIIGGAAVCLLIMLLWLVSLRREIDRRKIVEKQLVEAQVAAEAANDAKSAFLANMSHEIRTPLNAIIGFSELMSQRVFGEISPPRYGEYLNDIESSGRHLATVINDILDISKIEAGKWELHEREFDLNACIESAFKMVESLAVDKQIRMFRSTPEKQDQIIIMGDEVALKRAIINLFSNAVKFTPNGGMVSCLVSRNEANELNVTIKDTGIGIPEDKIEDVLKPFGQNADDQYMVASGSGTGLGLSIVKEIIELHGGHFSLESELYIGTEAIIILPAERIRSDQVEVKPIKKDDKERYSA